MSEQTSDPLAETVRRALGEVLWNASNYPRKAQPFMLGQDTAPLRDKATDAVVAALRASGAGLGGISREQIAETIAAVLSAYTVGGGQMPATAQIVTSVTDAVLALRPDPAPDAGSCPTCGDPLVPGWDHRAALARVRAGGPPSGSEPARYVVQDGRRYVQGPHDWVDIGPDEDPAPDDTADLRAEVERLKRQRDAHRNRWEQWEARAGTAVAERDAARADLAALREGVIDLARTGEADGRGNSRDLAARLRALLGGKP